ncbi:MULTISPECIES: RagB/SusD family nutrient uptake outer membrane protein [Flavobacterium]|uniref:RagB/SusD family nutrient uptake outer membrane protein n=1 Tax=Flavobacterium endoglycinae TaxID=2816357 RepID=A0ABX7QCN0_9FLAO|nr:RagB/SusD family nutrient uptake outer membrane protein [Flavobacterium endoglycinae]QSW88707.1 RagB/SusD family nutrient uptake outer membrane protein [Flavobacterium endoglycinae]
MKLKINKKYIALALFAVLSISCSDNFLEEKKNFGSVDDSFYESQERANWYINNVYFDYYSAFKSPGQSLVGSYADTYSKMTEEIGGIQPLINPNITYFNAADASGYYGGKLEDKINNVPYNRIRDCNSFIRDIDVKGATLDKTFRDQAKGQLYYLRAVQYFDLLRVYGGVPIVTEVQTPSTEDETIKLPRATVTEVVDQIVKDLDMAASLLPRTWNSADYGRVTKGAAMAVKSRVLLTYASPLFNKNWDGSNDRWNAALKAGLEAETELTAAGIGLYGNSAKDWQNMFTLGASGNAPCPEAITVQLLGTNTTNLGMSNSWEKAIRLISQGGTGAMEAPKEMIDLFPMANGSRPTAANGYNDFLFFVNRDPRFYRTFAFSGVRWNYKENDKPVVWAYRWLDASKKAYYSDSNNETSPALVRKMTDVTATNASSFQYSGTDIYEYRYAELLLNIAECYAALGQTGNTIAYLGRIRNRVGIPSANNYGIGTLSDKYAAIEAVLYERRVELAYEGKRYWDVQRWMLYDNATLAGTTGGTVSKLRLTPINGTQRTGNYLQYKNTATSADPLAAARASISADPDAANFQTQLAALAAFYTDNFTFVAPPTPMDNVNNVAVKIKFNPNYYIMGLQNTVLAQNPWLKQTIGWKDASGGEGDYNYQE